MSTYYLKTAKKYREIYQKSIENPEGFWEELATQNFIFRKKWNTVLQYDFKKPEIKWFDGAELNITENCIDRHLAKYGNKTAILFEPNDPKKPHKHISYNNLAIQVSKFANVLKNCGVNKGDRVCLYLPMIPELAYAMLACARIGAIHSIIFAGFSAKALATRINDCNCKIVITANESVRGTKTIPLKKIVDEALRTCPSVNSVLVIKNTKQPTTMFNHRDIWIEPLLKKANEQCAITPIQAEDPLFILYTSGSTGKPKGMVHSTAGYMLYTAYTFKNVFDYQETDIYWCTADIGWITGHSYIIYGPLLNGATTVMYEGIPSYPDFGRFWEIIDKHKITQFYTAPTAIRSLAKEPIEFVTKHNLNSLKVIGTVGEPIDEESWKWYHKNIGKKKCPVVDTWWQTETGGIMISSLPGIIPSKPSFATLPFIGVQPVLLQKSTGLEVENNTDGYLCILKPWPSIARTIWGDHERYRKTYFSTFNNVYFSGDAAFRDKSGYYRIIGRVDDIIIVSGHNIGTAPLEESINEHPKVIESAVIGYPHTIKGNALFGYIILKKNTNRSEFIKLSKEINVLISKSIGAFAKLDQIIFVEGLPKTRSGKIMRRILKKIALKDIHDFGDISTLIDRGIVDHIIEETNIQQH